MGLNWWLKPFQYHAKDPKLCFNRTLNLLIRPNAIKGPQLSHGSTPLSSDHDDEELTEYHKLTRSIPSDFDRADVSSDEETKL